MLYVFDMDGVLFRMDEPLPHAADAVRRVRDRGDLVRFLTNNSSRTRRDYADKLTRLGIPASPDEIMTSAYATGLLLRDEGHTGRRVFVIGEGGLKQELASAGMVIFEPGESAPATASGSDGTASVEFVVVGWDRGLTYGKLAEAHRAILGGATFIATNRDATYPDSGGQTLPGGGSIVAAVETSTGITPRTIGKPEPYTLRLLLRLTGVPASECLVIGDRLDTDIGVGKALGARTALVLTGVSTRAEAEAAGPSLRPDMVWTDLSELK